MSTCFISLESNKIFNQLILRELTDKGYEGLSLALIVIFPYIESDKNISITALSKKLGYTRQAMHKNIKKLEEAGYITLASEKKNQKEKIIRFTELGKALMDDSEKIIRRIEAEMVAIIGKEAFELYQIYQQKIHNYLSGEL